MKNKRCRLACLQFSVMVFFTLFACRKTEESEQNLEFPNEPTTSLQEDTKYIPVLRWHVLQKMASKKLNLQKSYLALFFAHDRNIKSFRCGKDKQSVIFSNKRLGLALLPETLESQPELISDAMYFTDTTTNNLVSVENNPVFTFTETVFQ